MKTSNRIPCLLLVSALLLAMAPTGLSQSAQLRVAQNRRFFEFENGKPFFYLADTAWELFHRLNRKEAELYLDNRAEKGFSQAPSIRRRRHATGGLLVLVLRCLRPCLRA